MQFLNNDLFQDEQDRDALVGVLGRSGRIVVRFDATWPDGANNVDKPETQRVLRRFALRAIESPDETYALWDAAQQSTDATAQVITTHTNMTLVDEGDAQESYLELTIMGISGTQDLPALTQHPAYALAADGQLPIKRTKKKLEGLEKPFSESLPEDKKALLFLALAGEKAPHQVTESALSLQLQSLPYIQKNILQVTAEPYLTAITPDLTTAEQRAHWQSFCHQQMQAAIHQVLQLRETKKGFHILIREDY